MDEQVLDKSPTYKLQIGGQDVTVRFCDEDSNEVKEAVRNILTRNYEEKIWEILSANDKTEK